MATRLLNSPLKWKRGTDALVETYIGANNEMVMDYRDPNAPKIRLHNNATPGGQVIETGITHGVATPVIQTPIDGGNNISNTPVITATGFMGVKQDGTAETHTGSYWELSTVSDFSSTVWQSGLDSMNLTSVDLQAQGIALNYEALYYARVKYVSADGVESAWSPVSSFTTAPVFMGVETGQQVASDSQNDDRFGISIAVSDDKTLALIGAYRADPNGVSNAGKVYVYDIDPVTNIWTEQRQITASDAQASDAFGISIAISQDKSTVLVGAKGADPNGISGAGKVYVYAIDPATGAWTEQQQITASDGAAGDAFGRAITLSLDKTMAVVGSTYFNNNTGKVYVYDINPVNNVWTERQQLTANDGTAGNYFGISIAISQDKSTVLIGASGATVNGLVDAGKVYVYDINISTNMYAEQQQILADDASTGDFFGSALSLSADKTLALIGAHNADPNGLLDAGKVYVYVNSGTWASTQQITASDGAPGDAFGRSVSLSPDKSMAIIGAHKSDYSGLVDAGKVYIFD